MAIPFLILLVATSITAGIYDLRSRRIPNWVSVTGFSLAVCLHTFWLPEAHRLGFNLPGVEDCGLGFVLAWAVYIPLYLLRAVGAGDAKLMGALGAIAGPREWVEILLITAILGGVMSLVVVLARRRARRTFRNLLNLIGHLLRGRIPGLMSSELDVRSPESLRMPHGSVIALGAIAVVVLSQTGVSLISMN